MNIQEIIRGLMDVIDQKADPSKDEPAESPVDKIKAKVQKTVNPVAREDVGLIPVEVVVNDNTEPDQVVMIPPGQASFEMLKKDSDLDNVYDERGIEHEQGSIGKQQVSTKKDELLDIQRLAGMPVISITN